MKTNPKMRDLADMQHAVERPQRDRAEVERNAAVSAPLDPYADHAMQIGPTRVFDQKTKTFAMKPAVVCSCGRLSDAVSTEYEAILAVRVHSLEVSLVRLARHIGLDLDQAPTAFERAKGGDASAIAALEARDEIMAGAVASAEGGESPEIPTATATLSIRAAITDAVEAEDSRLVDEALHGTGEQPPVGILDGQTTGSFVAAPADVDLALEDFRVRCAALEIDADALLVDAEALATSSGLTPEQARERVLTSAMQTGARRTTEREHDPASGEPLPEVEPEAYADDAQPLEPIEGSLWVCTSCDGRNALENDACAACEAERPESPDYVVPLDPEVAHAMLGPEHPLVRAAKGITDTNPEHRGVAWDAEQIAVTGGAAPEDEPDA